MSDGKGPTVSLFKIKDNYQLDGGFTYAQWKFPEKLTYVTDTIAILFNQTTRYTFKSQDHDLAIYCNKDYGPCFGKNELTAYHTFNS